MHNSYINTHKYVSIKIRWICKFTELVFRIIPNRIWIVFLDLVIELSLWGRPLMASPNTHTHSHNNQGPLPQDKHVLTLSSLSLFLYHTH